MKIKVTSWTAIKFAIGEFAGMIAMIVMASPLIFQLPGLTSRLLMGGLLLVGVAIIGFWGWDILKDGIKFVKDDNPLMDDSDENS